jgi:hypothetical protein
MAVTVRTVFWAVHRVGFTLFWRNILPPSSGSTLKIEAVIPPKRSYPSTRLQGVTCPEDHKWNRRTHILLVFNSQEKRLIVVQRRLGRWGPVTVCPRYAGKRNHLTVDPSLG